MSEVQERAAGVCCDPGAPLQAEQNLPSAVNFQGDRRPHISINVRSIRAALPFYTALFGARPTKLRDDYAKWETETPPVNLALNEHPDAVSRNGHFGIEVKSMDAVMAYHERLKRLKVEVEATEQNVACCFSVQTKVWAADPDGNHWEVFVVTDNEAEEGCQSTCICYDPQTGGCNWK
jgi:catechol 2,3-dioxygenase-like lactoylglutathione lyase family enzyme